jgi:hypothetical protein
VICFIACMLPSYLHASTEQDLKGAYRPATVVSVKKLDTTANYVYDIGIRVDCSTLYVARSKSANDYVPVEIAPNHTACRHTSANLARLCRQTKSKSEATRFHTEKANSCESQCREHLPERDTPSTPRTTERRV